MLICSYIKRSPLFRGNSLVLCRASSRKPRVYLCFGLVGNSELPSTLSIIAVWWFVYIASLLGLNVVVNRLSVERTKIQGRPNSKRGAWLSGGKGKPTLGKSNSRLHKIMGHMFHRVNFRRQVSHLFKHHLLIEKLCKCFPHKQKDLSNSKQQHFERF